MMVSLLRGLPATRRPLQVTFHDQKGLMHFLNRTGVFTYCSGDGGQPNGATLEFIDDRVQDLIVHLVQSAFVDVEGGEAVVGDLFIDDAVAFDLGEVADAAE